MNYTFIITSFFFIICKYYSKKYCKHLFSSNTTVTHIEEGLIPKTTVCRILKIHLIFWNTKSVSTFGFKQWCNHVRAKLVVDLFWNILDLVITKYGLFVQTSIILDTDFNLSFLIITKLIDLHRRNLSLHVENLGTTRHRNPHTCVPHTGP